MILGEFMKQYDEEIVREFEPEFRKLVDLLFEHVFGSKIGIDAVISWAKLAQEIKKLRNKVLSYDRKKQKVIRRT